jgi:hypothetical protein
MVRFLILILVLSLPGCSTRSSETLVLDTDSGIVDLAEQLPGEWQRVCILPPYSTNRTARELLGFDYNVESRSAIPASDGITLLLAVDSGAVAGAFEIGRQNIDFASLGAVCYGRSEARFSLPEQGWPHARHAR